MRIAYIVPTSSLFTFIYNEMIEVQEAGHDLIVVPLRTGHSSNVLLRFEERLKPNSVLTPKLFNVTIMCLAFYMFLTHPLRVLRTLLSLHRAAGFNFFVHASVFLVTPKALACTWWLRRLRVDRIHAHFASHTATCAGIVGSLTGIPFSFTAHAYDIYCTSMRLRNGTLGWKLRHAIQVFAISEHGRNLLRSRVPAIDRGRIHTVYVGIPLGLFKEHMPLAVKDELRLLCIASFDRKKGHDTLLDACALLQSRSVPFHLSLYGEGPLREALVDQIERLNLKERVKLGHAISQEEVANELAACHVFVMPCRKDPKTGNIDGIPTVFMEAMATGRPVISCPLAGIPELVRHGETGLLVNPDDPAAVAEAIIRLALDDPLRVDLGKKARALAIKQHDQRRNSRQLLDLMASADVTPFYN
jgi:colanic acid/amylovoran biosynthesis glycosyltransferase